MSSEQNKPIQIQLVVVDQHVRRKLLNIATAEGIDRPIEAYGFDRQGNPVFTDLPNIYYRFTGSARSGVNLNNIFNPVKRGGHESGGLRLYAREKGELKEKEHLYGFQALSAFLGMKGCSCPVEFAEAELTKLLKGKITRIYVFRSDELNGLASYHEAKGDQWIFSTFSVDFEMIQVDSINDLLKKLHSTWRVLTDKSLLLLRKVNLGKLME